MIEKVSTAILFVYITAAQSVPLPTFTDLSKVYSGYAHYGGKYSNTDVYTLIGQAPLHPIHKADTSALRLSIALNRLGGPHRLGTKQIHITKNNAGDSARGRDGQQYVQNALAFGPLLAMKYKSPQLLHPDPLDKLGKLMGKQGIVRFVMFYNNTKHANARIVLWDCDHFYQARDLTNIHHLISIELWELPDSKCPT